MVLTPARRLYHCSFCALSDEVVQCMITDGDGNSICNECVAKCAKIVREHYPETYRAEFMPVLNPTVSLPEYY